MSFAVAAALAVALLVAVPVLAHLLRRGQTREQEFPAASLVPVTPATARQQSRLEDRLILAVRAAMITALAVLGATPLMRCDRLSVARVQGASVALALVIDDSLSMRAEVPSGSSRWARAIEGARELLRSSREGDAVAIVLAGEPARMALATTTDLGAARDALEGLRPSDRPTDLGAAVQLARAALNAQPHVDKRVVVLSDLASDPVPVGDPPVWTPLEALTEAAADCGIVRADRDGDRVVATVACNTAMTGREVTISVAGEDSEAGPRSKTDRALTNGDPVVGKAAVAARTGEQTVTIELEDAPRVDLDARLDGNDAIREDDLAAVADRSAAPIVGVVADPAVASAQTGGPTVLEQALSVLPSAPAVRPLSVLPEEDKEYEPLAAILVDDPSGLSPAARAALSRYVERGGLALSLFGSRAATAQLSATLEPFAYGAVQWEETGPLGIDAASVSWLGPEASSLGELTRRGRARLDSAAVEGAEVVGRWQDGAPWLLERRLGRGLVWTVGLPASVEESDFALRPAFVALLDHVVRQAYERSGPGQTVAGGAWSFQGAEHVSVEGPAGPLQVSRAAESNAPFATPDLRGRYVIRRDSEQRERIVTLDPREILLAPAPLPEASRAAGAGETSAAVDISREVALLVLALFIGELLLRALRRAAARRGARPAATA